MKKCFLFLSVLFVFTACMAPKQSFKNAYFTEHKSQANFYLFEGKIAKEHAKLYMQILLNSEHSQDIIVKLFDEEFYAFDVLGEEFFLQSAKRADFAFKARLNLKANLPFIILNYDKKEYTLFLSQHKLSALEGAFNELHFDKHFKQGKDIKITSFTLKDLGFVLPKEYVKINQKIAYGANNAKELSHILAQLEQEQRLHILTDNSFMLNSEYSNFTSPCYLDENFITFCVNKYEYKGGAHGELAIKVFHFSLANGANLSSKTKDLLKNTQDERLLELVLQALAKYDGKSAKRFLKWNESKNTDKKEFIALPEEFFITQKGIKFVFAPYEIASYAEGFISIVLPFKDLKAFVREDSAFGILFE